MTYLSRKSGNFNVWAVADHGENLRRISNNQDPATPSFCPIFAPDNRRVAFLAVKAVSQKATTQLVIAAAPNEQKTIYQGKINARLLGWLLTGEHLFLAVIEEPLSSLPVGDVRVLRIDAATGVSAQALWLQNIYPNSLRLGPDHKQLLYVMRE